MDKLPPELTTVTPTSRYLAFALIIILPFIGFYLGWQYGMETAPSPTNGVTTTTQPPVPQNQEPEAPSIPNSNDTDDEPEPIDIGEPSPPSPDEPEPVIPPTLPEENTTCGVTNCHGVEVTCGDVSEGGLMCTMEYRIGDFCRQYVSCETINGTCQPVEDSQYETCVSCVNECTDVEDPMNAFDCEANCRAKLE